jgi:hypothetical protein
VSNTTNINEHTEQKETQMAIQLPVSLRDYFAAKAMQSIMAPFLEMNNDLLDPRGWMDGLAGDAYLMADAMLRAREAK